MAQKTTIRKEQAGIPKGGSTSEVLTKNSNSDYDVNWAVGGGGGGNGNATFIDQTPLGTASTYGLLSGAINSSNTTFTVSQGSYGSGVLTVILNGAVLQMGSGEDWVETTPGSGIFDLNVAPNPGDILTAIYQISITSLQTAVQFEDEGSALGTPGTVDEVDFTGAGVTASRALNKVTVNIPSGGGGGSTKKVGVGDFTDIQFNNTQISFNDSWWTSTGSVTSPDIVDFGAGNSSSAAGFPEWSGGAGNGLLQFEDGKQIIFRAVIRALNVNGVQNAGGIGFDIFGSNSILSSQGTNTLNVGFVRKQSDGQWYTRVADGTGFTENPVALVGSTKYVLRCEYDPGNGTPQARFYVDGVLIDTIITNIPSGGNNIIEFCMGNKSGSPQEAIQFASSPSFAVEV